MDGHLAFYFEREVAAADQAAPETEPVDSAETTDA
jgi:hypothetical protein